MTVHLFDAEFSGMEAGCLLPNDALRIEASGLHPWLKQPRTQSPDVCDVGNRVKSNTNAKHILTSDTRQNMRTHTHTNIILMSKR